MLAIRSLPPRLRFIAGLLGVYLFIYLWSVPMLAFDLVPAWGTWMGGFLLILQGTVLLLWLMLGAGWRGAVAAAAIVLISGAVEHVGVTTGWPFGRYDYTATLGLKVVGAVPLAIPFAWLLVVPSSLGVATLLVGGWRRVPLAAMLALGLDLLIEPVAAYVTRYWQWLDSGPYYGVPTANFIAWGSLALLLSAICWLCTRRTAPEQVAWSWLPALMYGLNVLQFTLVDLAYGFGWAVAIGLLLLVVCGVAVQKARVQGIILSVSSA